MRLVVLLVALIACKKVERYAPAEGSQQPPSPAQGLPPAQDWGGASGSASACVAERVTRLTLAMEDREDCTTEDDACKIDCAAGNAPACFHRGAQLQRIPERIEEAIALFGRACELGLAIACTNYGASVWLRSEDAACARRVFDKACGVKETFACGMIGRMMIASAQNEAEIAAARGYLERICQELSGPPCKMLANHLAGNELGAYDPAQLKGLLQRACEGGDASACQDLQSTGSK
jgi:hypothetical protein